MNRVRSMDQRRTGRRLAAVAAVALLATLGLGPAAAMAANPAPTAEAAVAERVEDRVEAQTESFELVVQAHGPRLTLYLDRYADNAPVTDARIELDAGGTSVAVQPQPDGSYAAQLPATARRASLPLTVVVTAGETSDLLALELPAQSSTQSPAPGTSAAAASDRLALPTAVLRGVFIAGVLIALTALALRAASRRRAHGKDVA